MKFRLSILSMVIVLVLSACGLENIKEDIETPIQKITLKNHQNNEQNTKNESNGDETTQSQTQNTKETKKESLTQSQKTANDDLTLEKKYFNQVQNVNGVPTIMNPDNILVMVNKEVTLPSHYRPNDLIRPNVPFSFGDQKSEKGLMRKEVAKALEYMFAGAKKDGIYLIVASGFRSYETQDYLFKREIEQVGREKAVQAVAKPGTSEHQTGLAMDITSSSMHYGLGESFTNKSEGKWLEENAYRYGFIMRYPKGKESITKYEYEPWHYRYVGVKIATKIYKNEWTLEEYLNKVKKV